MASLPDAIFIAHILERGESRCVWIPGRREKSQGPVEHNGRRRFGSWGSISEAFEDVSLPTLIPAGDGH